MVNPLIIEDNNKMVYKILIDICKKYIEAVKVRMVDVDNNILERLTTHKKIEFDDSMFPNKFAIFTKFGIGNRTTSTLKTNQFFAQFQIQHLLELNKKNYIHLKNDTYFLQSNDYFTNELYRFGGIQSIRGFNENSLQGNIFSGIFAEYRYVASPNLYFYTITDFGYYQDKANDSKDQLYGLGFGFGLLSNGGLFNLVYANGNTGNQTIKLSNSIVQISFKTYF